MTDASPTEEVSQVNRSIKIVGYAAAGVIATTGLALVVARLLRNYHSDVAPTTHYGELPEATADDRLPSVEEYLLIELACEFGWPAKSSHVRFGTDATEGPYLLFPLGSAELRVQFVDSTMRDKTRFFILSYDGTPVTGPLALPNPTYDDAVREFGHL